jgi:galactokinase
MNQPDLYIRVVRAFQARFQRKPEMVVRAPGRINLIGGHTDYNDGFVLPVAVDRAAWLAASPREEPEAIIRALDMGNDEASFPVDQVPTASGWSDYPKGVVWAFLARDLQPKGLSSVLASDIPVGAGMSSSAAVELAFAYTWSQLSKFDIPRSDLALLCQQAENEYVGVNCGIMDQMIIACGKAGHAMLLDTRTLEQGHFPMPKGTAIVVADSLVRRELANSEYNVRRAQCEQAVSLLKQYLPEIKALRDVSVEDLAQFEQHLPNIILKRARHVVLENARVLDAAHLLQQGDSIAVGALMVEAHQSLRDDYEVSSPELDALVEAATEVAGCYGARMVGGGFGGCIVALADEDAIAELQKHLAQSYAERFDKTPAVYVTRPADGVAVVART